MLTPNLKKDPFPTDLISIITITLAFAILGVIIGLPLFFSNFNLPSFEGIEQDTLEHFDLSLRYFFRTLGIIGIIIGGFTLTICLLTLQRKFIGWILLILIYCVGLIGFVYLIYRYIDMLSRYPNLPLPIFPLLGLAYVLIGLTILLNKKNFFIFEKQLNMNY